jgi:hypothetical protein
LPSDALNAIDGAADWAGGGLREGELALLVVVVVVVAIDRAVLDSLDRSTR